MRSLMRLWPAAGIYQIFRARGYHVNMTNALQRRQAGSAFRLHCHITPEQLGRHILAHVFEIGHIALFEIIWSTSPGSRLVRRLCGRPDEHELYLLL